MDKNNAQSLSNNLENEILGFIEQYSGTGGRLRELVSNTINKHYDLYAEIINANEDLLLPNYSKISSFMNEEFRKNSVISDNITCFQQAMSFAPQNEKILLPSQTKSRMQNGVIKNDIYVYDITETTMYGMKVCIAETVDGKKGFLDKPEEYINTKFMLMESTFDHIDENPHRKDTFVHCSYIDQICQQEK